MKKSIEIPDPRWRVDLISDLLFITSQWLDNRLPNRSSRRWVNPKNQKMRRHHRREEDGVRKVGFLDFRGENTKLHLIQRECEGGGGPPESGQRRRGVHRSRSERRLVVDAGGGKEVVVMAANGGGGGGDWLREEKGVGRVFE
ncbi:hypothetical protein E3N88_27469 [Mikania micrantha]|uniref:Uncharacterized protein n=1 Tax=Mikania micrantha TaxID=192012 RepID=A0A5N6MWW1_9ASTR|nr:hypothetical protein E3N88_27469 [Mikania micrantha]